MKKTGISAILSLSMLLTVSCNGITNTQSNSNNTQSTQKSEEKVIQFRLTQDIIGLEAPISAKDISSVEINGEVIKGSDINTDSFTTKARTSTRVTSLNSADLKIFLAPPDTAPPDTLKNIVIKFNLANAKDPLVLNLIGDLFNPRLIKITYKNGKYYGGIGKDDGTIDENKITFSQEGNTLLINDPASGKQITFDTQALGKNTNVKPIDEKPLTSEALLKISQDIAARSGGLVSGIVPYVGTWKFTGFGKNLEINILNISKGNFSINVNLDGTDYTGSGNYDSTLKDIKQINFKSTVQKNDKIVNVEVKLELSGTNNLNLTLISADDKDLQNVINIPFLLSRKIPIQTTQPDTDKNAKFIRSLFLDVLGREADPNGLNFFLTPLNNGQINKQQLVTVMLTSQEGLAKKVDDFFKEILERPTSPTLQESQPFISLIGSSGYSSINARAVIFSSDEFVEKFGKYYTNFNNPNYNLVIAWKVIILGKDPISDKNSQINVDLNNYTHQLDTGATRLQVAKEFLARIEFKQLLVKNLYTKYLNRDADQAGLNFSVNLLESGATDIQLEAVLLSSTEYYAKATQ